MGLEFLIKDGTAHYITLRDKCDAIRNIKAPKISKRMPNFLQNGEFLIDFLQKLATAINPNLQTDKETCTLSLD